MFYWFKYQLVLLDGVTIGYPIFFVNRDFGMQEYNYKAICLNRDKTQENRQNRGKNTPMFIYGYWFCLIDD